MPVTVLCPSCKAKLKAPDNLVGKNVKCPGCGSAVLVKAIAAAAPAAAPKAASGSSPKAPALAKAKPAPPPKPQQPLDELDELDDVEDVEDEPVKSVTKTKGKKTPPPEEETERGPVSDDDKTKGMLIHLGTFINLIFAPFGYVVPIAIWVMKKKDSPFVDHHGKEWLNFNISMFVLTMVLGLVLGTLGGVLGWLVAWWLGLIFFALLGIAAIALGLYANIMYILMGLKAKKGEWARYKCLFRLFK